MTSMQPANRGRPSAVRTLQHKSAGDHIKVRLYHLAEPFGAWLLLAAVAWLFRMFFPGVTLAMVLAGLGMVLAALDYHLRSHRTKLVGRWIGPVTALVCTGWLVMVVYAGFSKGLLEAWLVGGLAGCIGWDIWIAAGDHHDLARAFVPAAESAGLGGSRLSNIMRKKTVTTAALHLPRGELTTRNAADRVENLEGALGYPPGSWSITSDRSDAGMSAVAVTDPQLLDRAPFPFPGPSAPGESVSVPFRLGPWADGEPFAYDVLPLHHLRMMGATGSGKSKSWWTYFAEGITRYDYACLAADVTKGDQFLGPLRPALHHLVTDPDQVPDLVDAVDRIIRARCDYLAKHRVTEWRPGCGLTFCDLWLEETPDILALLDRKQLQQYVKAVRASRTAGVAHRQSYQRTDHTQVPTIARAQMGYLCFGVMDKKDGEFGLSDVQRERGARPWLWGVDIPGKALWDTLTIPDPRKTMPMRFYDWGPDATRIAAYCSEWPASQRKLDDVTGEALEAVPGRDASTAFPAPRSPAPRKTAPARTRQNGTRQRAAVKGTDSHPPRAAKRMVPADAEKRVTVQLEQWGNGHRFTARELIEALGEDVICTGCTDMYCTGRTRGWLYTKIRDFVLTGMLADLGGTPTQWEVCLDEEPS